MLGRFWRRLVLFLNRERATQELEEEMRLHRDLRAESLERQGLEADAARTEATRRFGRSAKATELGHDAWGWGTLTAFRQDVRYAARRLRQHAWFTTAVVSILALGTGATTAMFSAVDAAFLRPLPFTRADELMSLERVNIPSNFRYGGVSRPSRSFDIDHVREMRDVFSQTAAYASGGLNLGLAERPRRVATGVVSGDFFTTLGVRPLAGRAIDSRDASPEAPRVVVLSWAVWQDAFAGGQVVGTLIPLNGNKYEVIGVMPRGFSFPNESDLWIPLGIPITSATFEPFRGYLPSRVLARRAAGVTAATAESRMQEAWARVVSNIPREPGQRLNVDETLKLIKARGATSPLRDSLIGDRRTALLVLFGVTGTLLLIACANVTNLLLSYGAARSRELALRTVLGATRRRLLGQLLAESVMLSVGGALAGVIIAPAVLGVLRTLMPAALAGVAPVQLDARVLAFASIVAISTGILFGLWPAFGATRGHASDALKSGGRAAGTRGTRRGQRVLVAAELALAAVLLVGAGLMLRSFEQLVNAETGMTTEQVATLELSFVSGSKQEDRVGRAEAILANVRRLPGVQSAGIVNDLPLRGGGGIGISVTVAGAPDSARDIYPRYLVASDGYLEALGIELRRGRTLSATDGTTSRQVAVISESMARAFWPGVDAIGRTFLFGGDGPPVEVVGVVADVREGALEQPAGPQMYFPARGNLAMNLAVVARGTGPAGSLLAGLRDAVRAVDPTQPVYNVRMMDEVVGKSMAARKANTVLITLFGALALLIAALGVYAVTSNAVSQRMREFGIRAALGATRRDLLRHVGSEMVVVLGSGVLAGAGLAWAASRVMQNLLYDVGVHDLRTFATAPVVLMVAAIVATLIPAARATRVQPVEVMREE